MQNASLRALERIGSQAEGYAEQIVSTEAYRMEKRFADAVKGLHVYGAKVTDGKAISVLKAKAVSYTHLLTKKWYAGTQGNYGVMFKAVRRCV